MLLLQTQRSTELMHYIYLFLGLSNPKSKKQCLIIFNKIYVILLCLVLSSLSAYCLYSKVVIFYHAMLPTIRVLDIIVHCDVSISVVFFIIFASYARRNSIRSLKVNMEKLELTFIKRFRFRRERYGRKILLATILLYEIFIFTYIAYDYIFVCNDLHTQLSFYINMYIMSVFILQIAGHLSELRMLIQFFNKKLEDNLQAPVGNCKVNMSVFLQSYYDIWGMVETINYSYGYQIAFIALTVVVTVLSNINHFVKTVMGLQLNRTEWIITAVVTCGNSCLFMVILTIICCFLCFNI